MRRFLIFLAASALALSACLGRTLVGPTATPLPLFTATAASEAATATLAATAAAGPTTAPTGTGLPASPTAAASATSAASPTAGATNAPAASASPAATATPDPNEAVGDVVYQDKLDGTGGWFWTFADDVATFGVTDGKLKGVMKTANSGWRFTISQDSLKLGSQQVSLNAHTVTCGPNDEYGLMLRLQPDAGDNTSFDGYSFKLRCSGQASFEMITGIERKTIVDWTDSPAIKTGAPADNTLLVWAGGSDFRFYVNGQYLFSASDSTLKDGFYGVYLYDRTAGGETVNFDTLTTKAVAK